MNNVEECFDKSPASKYKLYFYTNNKPPTAPYILNLHLYETLELHVVIQTPYRFQCHLKIKDPLAVEKHLSMVYV